MSLITVTVEVFNNQTVNTPYLKLLAIPQIKLVTSEDYNYFTDRAYLLYYNTQSMITERYLLTQTADALETLIQGTADIGQNTAMFPVPIFLNKIDRRLMGKLSLINTDSVVNINTLEADTPAKVLYDLGERNQAKHKELEWCSYPLSVIAVDTSENTVTVACCVDNFLVYDTSITIGGDPFTVLSSICTDDGGVILIEGDISGVNVGDVIELT